MHLQNNRFKHFSYCLRFGGVLILTALIAGLGGILLHEFLDLIEYLVFGHGETSTAQAVSTKQFILIVLAGIISAILWYFYNEKIVRLFLSNLRWKLKIQHRECQNFGFI